MTTLTQTAYYTRRVIALMGVLLVGVIIGKAVLSATKTLIDRLTPEPPPKPTLAFGKLPQLKFPENKNLPDLSIKLETIQGTLPTLENIGKVYFMPQKSVSLLSLERAKEKALKMGFKNRPEKITEILFRWESEELPITYLEMNTNSENFYLRHNFEETPTILGKPRISNEETMIDEAKKWLRKFGYLPKDLSSGSGEAVFLRFAPPNLIPANSLSESNFVRVNLFKVALDEKKVLPPDPKNSTISLLISGVTSIRDRVVEAKYTYFETDRESFATYPLKPVDIAWQELQEGKAYIAHLGENESGKITIRKVYLAYYDSETPQNFLQLIYVFEGDRNFFAYVPAIDPNYQE